ncbi:MAG TPA: tetratricopeptide repeat protein [Gammaproteobacteria bacterium]
MLIYANYKEWVGLRILASLSGPKLYILLRIFRTLTLCLLAAAIIGFLYFEIDFFRRGPLPVQTKITRTQCINDLERRIRSIENRLKYADSKKAEALQEEKTALREKLDNIDRAYLNHIRVIGAHIASLEKLYGQAPVDLLDKARKALAVNNIIEADIVLESIESNYPLKANAAGRVAWVRGYLANYSGDYAKVYEHFSRAAQFIPGNAELDMQAGYAASKMEDYKLSAHHHELALTDSIRQYGEVHSQVAEIYRYLGWLASKRQDYKRSYEYHEKAMQIDLKIFPADHQIVAQDYYRIGSALEDLGKYREAISYLEQALAIDLKKHPKDHPSIIHDYVRLASIWEERKEYRKSALYYQRALDAALRTYGEDHIAVADYRSALGWLWGKSGEYANSLTYYEQALHGYRKHYPNNHPDITNTLHNIKTIKRRLQYQKR